MDYIVRVQPQVVRRVEQYGRWFEKQRQAPVTSARWVDRVYNEIFSLRYAPYRCEVADESNRRRYEIRRLIIGDYLALFTIDELAKTVHVVSFRHGSHRPRMRDLPKDPPA